MAELTILMPVYNSISRNGGGFLQQALNSLLAQTFTDFEIHILDNQSIDGTAKICKQYALKDNRIKFSIDTKKRFPEGGINKLADTVTTKYLMIACCDDLWNHYCIEELIKILKSNPTVDMVYPNGTFVDIHNHIGSPLLPKIAFDYTSSMEQNFCLNIQFRNVVPLVFGIFKSEAYINALPFIPFDKLKANVDNLFLAKFFLNGCKAKIYDRELFYYRNRKRDLIINAVEDMPNNPILIWIYYINHQLKFYKMVAKDIPNNKPLLNLVAIDSCIRCIGPLLSWIIKDLTNDAFERNILNTIHEKYEILRNLLLTTSYPQLTPELYEDTYRKMEILKTRILEHILNIVTEDKLILETIGNLNGIKENLQLKSN